MDMSDACIRPLRNFMSADFFATRKELELTQAQMAELLDIDLRSYADLEHGKSLCSTRVLLLYLLRCKEDRDEFILNAGRAMESAQYSLVD